MWQGQSISPCFERASPPLHGRQAELPPSFGWRGRTARWAHVPSTPTVLPPAHPDCPQVTNNTAAAESGGGLAVYQQDDQQDMQLEVRPRRRLVRYSLALAWRCGALPALAAASPAVL